ncbi:hypothetical protein QYE76_025015 [Lolium multiflorum]|uniref:Uncharacterized protein n=1 Tax=Lolium multiflorum TaxID=4521 RepID=A0AAD8RHS1_LOLMU|nr:hypothetical protein QYE76_025015 [Lolium multiflorum]
MASRSSSRRVSSTRVQAFSTRLVSPLVRIGHWLLLLLGFFVFHIDLKLRVQEDRLCNVGLVEASVGSSYALAPVAEVQAPCARCTPTKSRWWPCGEACWLHGGDAWWVMSLVVMSTAEATLKKSEGIGCRRRPRAIDIDGGDIADTGGSGFDGHGCSRLSAFRCRVDSRWARTMPSWTCLLSAPTSMQTHRFPKFGGGGGRWSMATSHPRQRCLALYHRVEEALPIGSHGEDVGFGSRGHGRHNALDEEETRAVEGDEPILRGESRQHLEVSFVRRSSLARTSVTCCKVSNTEEACRLALFLFVVSDLWLALVLSVALLIM